MLFLKRSILSLIAVAILPFSNLSAETMYQRNDCKSKLEEVDKEIQYLEDLKLGLEGRATRYENQAQRLQFEKDQLIEAKRFWNMADQNRKAATELEKKIIEKKKERQQLMDKYNCQEIQPSNSLSHETVDDDETIENEKEESASTE